MINSVCSRILFLCDIIPNVIREIPEEELEARPGMNTWSKKEILGHLIDSAANNHQRFVRAQAEAEPAIAYEQDAWVNIQNYQSADINLMITFWEAYNRHIAHVISNIPKHNLSRNCRLKAGESQTLLFLIEDYLSHLEHHVKQLVEVSESIR